MKELFKSFVRRTSEQIVIQKVPTSEGMLLIHIKRKNDS